MGTYFNLNNIDFQETLHSYNRTDDCTDYKGSGKGLISGIPKYTYHF